MQRYFESNVEDAVRIAVVEADTEDAIRETIEARYSREIAERNLPDDFGDWTRYTAHAYIDTDAIVEVMSRDGK